ncbi:MAG: carboxypeptidase-like regulatory domain-containing protein [Bacillota bacterium]|nr:carboxypeptidase-like regulatory domain-containing protein [Bacillota bacterium]
MSYQVNRGPKNLAALGRRKEAQPEAEPLQSTEAAGAAEEAAGSNDLELLLQGAGVLPGGEQGPEKEGSPLLELGRGFLAVNVYSGGNLLPLAGAVVTITTAQTLGQLVWARAISNTSGQILPVALPAPPRLLSQYPETPPQLAYGRYNVYVQAAGMLPGLRENVEIFDGITSIQDIGLLPRGSGPEQPISPPEDVGLLAVGPGEEE